MAGAGSPVARRRKELGQRRQDLSLDIVFWNSRLEVLVLGLRNVGHAGGVGFIERQRAAGIKPQAGVYPQHVFLV